MDCSLSASLGLQPATSPPCRFWTCQFPRSQETIPYKINLSHIHTRTHILSALSSGGPRLTQKEIFESRSLAGVIRRECPLPPRADKRASWPEEGDGEAPHRDRGGARRPKPRAGGSAPISSVLRTYLPPRWPFPNLRSRTLIIEVGEGAHSVTRRKADHPAEIS